MIKKNKKNSEYNAGSLDEWRNGENFMPREYNIGHRDTGRERVRKIFIIFVRKENGKHAKSL